MIENNLLESCVILGRSENGVVLRSDDITWVYTGFPCLNRVLQARFAPEEAEDRVQEVMGYFRDWEAPFSWVLGPSSWPLALPEMLRKHGCGSPEVWLGMAMDLSTAPPLQSAHLHLEKITDDSALHTWTNLGSGGHHHEQMRGAEIIFSKENAAGDKRCRFYLAYVGDQAVSRVMSFHHGEAVGLYWLSTDVNYRGKGITSALARHALDEARDAGARYAVIPAHPATRKLCETLGFGVYCQFTIYNWPPAPTSMNFC